MVAQVCKNFAYALSAFWRLVLKKQV